MLSECLDRLDPYEVDLISELPKFLEEGFAEIGIVDPEEIQLPIRLVKLLGQCSTAAYLDCPNLPEWHQENSLEFEIDNYLDRIGIYFWFDFDIIGADGQILELRAVYNQGDPDCNDGTWGEVWERNTGEVVADLTSTGDCESIIEVVSEDISKNYQAHERHWPSGYIRGEPAPFIFCYQNDLELEKLIGLAIRWVHAYSHPFCFQSQFDCDFE